MNIESAARSERCMKYFPRSILWFNWRWFGIKAQEVIKYLQMGLLRKLVIASIENCLILNMDDLHIANWWYFWNYTSALEDHTVAKKRVGPPERGLIVAFWSLGLNKHFENENLRQINFEWWWNLLLQKIVNKLYCRPCYLVRNSDILLNKNLGIVKIRNFSKNLYWLVPLIGFFKITMFPSVL